MGAAWVGGRAAGTITTPPGLVDTAVSADTLRVRPLVMTVATNIFGLLPVLFHAGVGPLVAQRIAAPMWAAGVAESPCFLSGRKRVKMPR